MGKPGAAIRAAGWVTVGAIAAGGVATAATTGGSSSGSGTLATPVAAVASTSPSASPSTGAKKAAGKGKLAGRVGKLAGRVLHGEFTVEGKGGTPTKVAEQRGTVNAVSSSAITLTSKDGYKHTYVVNSDTRVRVDAKKGAISGVRTGQDATVLAKVSATTETAETVVQRAAK
ncbi:MAG TPA: hypothetical protein VHX15_00380 [Frankiaceae bacterium]|jgi:hypothetical protein|nr:hypothetical protein [Frankiaceae bacterium]